jgi:hypothetical protein
MDNSAPRKIMCDRTSLSSRLRTSICLISLVLGSLFLSRCMPFHPGPESESIASFQYPTSFIKPVEIRAGYGMAPLYRTSQDVSYHEAASMALRHLSWAYPLRVKGERLYEHGPDGSIDFRGQEVELQESTKPDSASCKLDSIASEGSVWVRALPKGTTASFEGIHSSMPIDAPSWLLLLPSDADYVYSIGVSKVSYRNEAESWDLATYNAVIELAFTISSKQQHLGKTVVGEQLGMSKITTDVVIKGFRVVERWRSARTLYVLAQAETNWERT